MKNLRDSLTWAGLGLALLILILVQTLAFHSEYVMVDAADAVENTLEVIGGLDGILAAAAEMGSTARGYILSGDPQYIEPYDIATKTARQNERQLVQLLRQDPAQLRRLESLEALIERKMNLHNGKIEVRRTQGFDAALKLFLAGNEHNLMDDIRDLVLQMKSEERGLLRRRQDDAHRAVVRSRVAFLIGFALSFAILVLIYYRLTREILRRRQSEGRLVQLNEDLERRVVERTAQLASVNNQLEERNREVEKANRMKSQFLTRMSHELRTPLNAIIGFSDLLSEESAGPLHDKYRRFVGHIHAGAYHLLGLINDILDVAKIEAGRIELKQETFGVYESAGEVLSMIRPLASNKKLEIVNKIGTDQVVYADRIRFKQILYNLISNAVKFTPEGGRVWIDASNEPDRVCIAVGDTGIGIPIEEQAAIFEEFHQVSPSPREPGAGSGLGLNITRRLVELHGGKITVESEPQQGSLFTFYLPHNKAPRFPNPPLESGAHQ